ncbi:MAG: hypothetical protein AAGD04_09810 [Pseudomonadota bacterium]
MVSSLIKYALSRVRLGACALALGSALFATTVTAQDSVVTLPKATTDPVVAALPGVADHGALEANLQVFLGAAQSCCTGKLPLAGTYEKHGADVVFKPAFGFLMDQAYTVRSFVGGPDAQPVLRDFVIGSGEALVRPEVLAIYPSGPQIPENTLRFYIHFSTPMQPHRAGEFIALANAQGQEDGAAFMTFKQELWNADRTRLTLLMDPGRIKRGVAQNLALGPALEEGQRYALVVKEGWPAALGAQRQTTAFSQDFQVSAPLRSVPELNAWTVSTPRQGSREPLVIRFDRPFDAASAQDALTLVDAEGQVVSGRGVLEDHQNGWRFEPDSPWQSQVVTLLVDAQLEDVAGNNLIELLDTVVGTGLGAAGLSSETRVTVKTRDITLQPAE